MTISLRSLLFLLTLMPSALRFQLLDWSQRTRGSLRFLVFCILTALTTAFYEPFRELPSGWFGVVLSHLFTVPGAFAAAMLTTFFVSSAGMGLLAHKVSRTF